LSVFINYVCAIKSHFEVPKSVFVPSPKVDGIFLNMKVREQIPLNNEELKRFLLMLKKCFKFRRKTLIKNILDFLGKEYFLSIEQ
jgi:16S rRNA (adenine1518-N6/adenine1519-N6)-dimethyltransferase